MDGPYYRGGPPPPSRQQQQQQPQEPALQQEGFWSRLTNKIFAGSEDGYVALCGGFVFALHSFYCPRILDSSQVGASFSSAGTHSTSCFPS